MIKITELYKSFDNKEVLKGINLTINNGECVCIIGKSGTGKSILLKHIIGLVKPDIGEISINNKIINNLNFKELQKIRTKISIVFQSGALFDDQSVIDNVCMPLIKYNYSNKKNIELAKEALKEVDLEGCDNMMPSELSGGMKKRVGIARAISPHPDYILYDEPTTGLDPIMTESINKLIKKIHKEENLTSIIVTHEMKTVYSVATRVIFLDEGYIKYDGLVENMKDTSDKTLLEFIAGSGSLD
tara:strand:+ start:159 stop:890 length:732 start_codon:yes stop_codon:yes gene_type:complete